MKDENFSSAVIFIFISQNIKNSFFAINFEIHYPKLYPKQCFY